MVHHTRAVRAGLASLGRAAPSSRSQCYPEAPLLQTTPRLRVPQLLPRFTTDRATTTVNSNSALKKPEVSVAVVNEGLYQRHSVNRTSHVRHLTQQQQQQQIIDSPASPRKSGPCNSALSTSRTTKNSTAIGNDPSTA